MKDFKAETINKLQSRIDRYKKQEEVYTSYMDDAYEHGRREPADNFRVQAEMFGMVARDLQEDLDELKAL